MNEEGRPLGQSGEPSNDREEAGVGKFHEPSPSDLGMKIALVIFALIAALAGGYGWRQHNAAQEFASSRNDLSASLALVRSQTDTLTAKLNALNAERAQEEAARAESERAKNQELEHAARATRRSTVRNSAAARPEDPRWQPVQLELGKQQKQLADNKQQIDDTQAKLQQTRSELEGNLQSTRTELNGGIARNHNELVALERKGERNFFEFDIQKGKSFHRAGSISILVRKANASHGYCDLQMVVNDQDLSRKHVNLYESVTFYPEGSPLPVEVVINRIGKDVVHGYVSEPKYRAPAAAPTTALVSAPGAAAPDGSRPSDAP
jgi:hypothetical protein